LIVIKKTFEPTHTLIFQQPSNQFNSVTFLKKNIMAIPLGQIDFNTIEPEYGQLALAVQNFLSYGSKRGHVLIEELVIVSDVDPLPTRFVSVSEALKHGTKFFDACLYFTIPDERKPPIRILTDQNKPASREYGHIGEAIFVIYFYLLTRARVPARTGLDADHPIPRFLTNVLSLTQTMAHYLTLVAGFDIAKMDHKWIKEINMNDLGDEFRNRAGLGVAGYRMFGPFKSYTPMQGIAANLVSAVNVARQIATAPPDWDIHPLTRNPIILSNLGNLNKNLGNLILEVFTEAQITQMIDAKMIFQKPRVEPTHRQYRTWNIQQLIQLSNPIFHV
jgi:hypothetical protein